MKTELQKFYELADDIKVAMMTTRRERAPPERLTRSSPTQPALKCAAASRLVRARLFSLP